VNPEPEHPEELSQAHSFKKNQSIYTTLRLLEQHCWGTEVSTVVKLFLLRLRDTLFAANP